MDHGALQSSLGALLAGRRACGVALRLAGWLAAGLSLAFVGWQVWQQNPWQLVAARGEPLLGVILLGTLGYGVAGLLLSTAWRELLGPTARRAPASWHHAVYGRTQLAKYLPGNLFHLAGRQILGRRLGHDQATLAAASLAEAASLIAVAGMLALPVVWSWLGPPPAWSVAIALSALVMGLWLARSDPFALLARARAAWPGLPGGTRGPGWPQVLRAGLLHAAFFLTGGVILWLLALAVAGAEAHALDPLLGTTILAAAWVVGFITPGSSAGIGVREAMLTVLLAGSLGAEASTLVALALRLVTTCGDVVLFAIAIALPSPVGPTKIDPPPSQL